MEVLDSIVRDLVHAHPGDAADIASRMDIGDAAQILSATAIPDAAETLRRMPPVLAAACLTTMPESKAVALIEALPAPIAAGLLRSLNSRFVKSLLARASNGGAIEEQLRYPAFSVGHAMDSEIPAIPLHWSVGRARETLSEVAKARCPYLYVTDASGALVGVLHVSELEQLGDSPIERVMGTPVIRLQAYSSLESILDHPAWRDYDVLPVTGWMDVLVGILRHKDLRRHRAISPHGDPDAESFADVVLSLGELYWSSLWKVVDGFAPVAAGSELDTKGRG